MIGEINVTLFKSMEMSSTIVVFWKAVEEGISSFEPEIREEKVIWTWVDYSEGVTPRGAFKIPTSFERLGLLQKLADELDEKFKVRATSTEGVPSKLEATQYHLEDMRKILFDFNWIELQRGEPIEKEEIGNEHLDAETRS